MKKVKISINSLVVVLIRINAFQAIPQALAFLMDYKRVLLIHWLVCFKLKQLKIDKKLIKDPSLLR
jgi:hypothetical protein